VARQIIDIGTSANKGDGDPLRTAFDKINDNFSELYSANGDAQGAASNILPDADATYDLGSTTKQWADLHVSDFIYLNGTRLEVDVDGNLLIGGQEPKNVTDIQGSVFADDSTLLVDAVNGKIVGPVEASTITSSSYVEAGSVNANVFGVKTVGSFINLGTNASSVNVVTNIDMLNNTINNATVSGYISVADLKTVVAASLDFEEFQTRIAAL
jgi:hypothetical protein